MNARIHDEPEIIELDGPPTAYFEIPLDYHASANGEIEPAGHPEAARMIQRVIYINFRLPDQVRAQNVIDRVKARLRELGGGYIWWRLRPQHIEDGQVRLRLGTTPQLPKAWWERVSSECGNLSQNTSIPGLPQC